MRLQLLSLLAAFFAPFALADVKFTTPAAGGSVAAGTISVQWTESGVAPSISDLSTYQLFLMVGGNEATNAQQLAQIGPAAGSTFSTGNKISGAISPGVASSLKNGFYLKMISTAKEGGTVTNYSNRFTVTGLTGVTPATYQQAVTALAGSTAGPATENAVSNAAQAPAAGGAAAGAGAAGFNVPFNQQEGLTRYAPMQGVPPTKITAKNPTPLFPTSAFEIAKTWVAHPSQVTTLTESQTFSVQSKENTAAAQSQPSGDMAKFLARWKD